MEQVVFAYILRYNDTLFHLGLSFVPDYKCVVDEGNKQIKISSKSSNVKGLYGEFISSLTAIVGNNGAGKTTALRFLLNSVVDGSAHVDVQGIVITSDGEELELYTSDEFKDFSIVIDGVHVVPRKGWPDIPTFIYDGYFRPFLSDEDILTMEWAGSINASDGFRLRHELQSYGNELTSGGSFSLRDYATAYTIQNDHRICMFLNQYQGMFREDLNLPEFILVTPNTAGRWAIANRQDLGNNVYVGPPEYSGGWKASDRRLTEIIHNSLCNFLADGFGDAKYWERCIGDWKRFSINWFRSNIINTFSFFIQEWGKEDGQRERSRLESVLEVIKCIHKYCRIDEENIYSQFYFYLQEDAEKLDAFLSFMSSQRLFLTSRFIDLHYAHNLNNSYTTLSSGEQLMLNMYSRIYDAVIVEKTRIENPVEPVLFVFDEAEIGFHPEWQRCYISNLTNFLSDMAKASGQKYQVIITSHSPIILSDIPAECTIVLKRDKKGVTRCITQTDWQTFGTNIFDLYRESFFLENGLIGKFASEYIEHLDRDIDTFHQSKEEKEYNKERELLLARIKLIGDERMRKYFLYRLDENERQRLIAFHQKKLSELRDE